jgi:hypothetical protein
MPIPERHPKTRSLASYHPNRNGHVDHSSRPGFQRVIPRIQADLDHRDCDDPRYRILPGLR